MHSDISMDSGDTCMMGTYTLVKVEHEYNMRDGQLFKVSIIKAYSTNNEFIDIGYYTEIRMYHWTGGWIRTTHHHG